MLHFKIPKTKLIRALHILWEVFKIALEIANLVCSIIVLFS